MFKKTILLYVLMALFIGCFLGIQLKTINKQKEIINNQNTKMISLHKQVNELKINNDTKNQELEKSNNKINELNDSINIKTQTVNKPQAISRGVSIRETMTEFNISSTELNLLYKCVQSESGNQPHMGKVAVVNVILNRVKSPKFPNTITGVIYAKNQFQVVSNGAINRVVPTESTINAVQAALNGEKSVDDDVLYFATPTCNFGNWAIFDKQIGGHYFWKAK